MIQALTEALAHAKGKDPAVIVERCPSILGHDLTHAAVLCAALAVASCAGPGSRARISEETRVLDTYPFSDPNPVPVLATDRRLYPYHTFEGYAATSEPREWKVVRMENDLIEVFVLPEVGGKVWGAVVKETGHEFIYRNEVMKFRDIALRGPWTSGGLEFNFGVIGHTPATATPVDYLVRENADGSVSTIVGATDLPSRTPWRVEIRLPPDRAAFETRVLWYNPTPLEQPYYNWMTAAAFAQDDLELFVPGNAYLEHSGAVRSWPLDEEGRFLPLYRNNAFEGHKSYHVVGALNDFFGGYYHDEGYGWGHWAPHEEMPGRKMWPVGALPGRRHLGGPAYRHGRAVRRVPGGAAARAVLARGAPQPHRAGRVRSAFGQPLDRVVVPAGRDGRSHGRVPPRGHARRTGGRPPEGGGPGVRGRGRHGQGMVRRRTGRGGGGGARSARPGGRRVRRPARARMAGRAARTRTGSLLQRGRTRTGWRVRIRG